MSGFPGQAGYGQEGYGQGGYAQPPSGQTGYGPPSYGQGPPAQGPYGPVPPHVPGARGSGPRRGQTAVLVTVLVLVLLAVGGGAYALVSKYTGHKAAGPHNPTVSAPARTPASTGSTTPTSPASGTATASPTKSPKPTHTAKPKPKAGLIVSPAASANPAEPRVAALVNQYFTAINTHNYTAYNNLLEPQLQASNTRSSFHNGYATTRDLNEQLTGISDTSGGGEAATLSFTSHQNASDSPSGTPCTNWTITLYLEPSGSSYLIGPAPSGYHAHFAAC